MHDKKLWPCPLCLKAGGELLKHNSRPQSLYKKCSGCGLISLDPQDRLDFKSESERYRLHNNDFNDPRYREYLSEKLLSLKEYFTLDSEHLLDFGCGEAAAIEKLSQALGLSCRVFSYDPHFYPEKPNEKFDGVLAIEVVEHFYDVQNAWAQMSAYLKPKGLLFVWTHMWDQQSDFSNWWYAKDPTHVVFYSKLTLEYLCREFGLKTIHLQKGSFVLGRA